MTEQQILQSYSIAKERSAVIGAGLNVKINAASLKDEEFKAKILADAAEIESKAIAEEQRLIAEVNKKING